MAFIATSETTDTGITKITLSGELDASVAPIFKTEVEKAAGSHAKRLVLIMNDLAYMSSAGLRALIFAKQKMGTDVDIYVVGAPTGVIETLELTGFQHSVIILDTYDTEKIENF